MKQKYKHLNAKIGNFLSESRYRDALWNQV